MSIEPKRRTGLVRKGDEEPLPEAPGRALWIFFGRADLSPTLEDLRLHLEDLAPGVVVGAASGGSFELDDDLALASVPLGLRHEGAQGGLTVRLEPPSPRWQATYDGLELRTPVEASPLRGVYRLDALDAGATRTYRELVRPLLCALGELLPWGVAVRDGESRGFTTDGMRSQLPAAPTRSYRLEGELEFDAGQTGPAERLSRTSSVLRSRLRWSGRALGLSVRALDLPAGLWAYTYRDLLALARRARGGSVRVTCDGAFETTVHAHGA